MSFKVDDNEWRDAVRRHFLHIWGESLNNIPEDREGTFHGHDGTQYPFHGKAELLEAMLNDSFKKWFRGCVESVLRRTRLLSAAA